MYLILASILYEITKVVGIGGLIVLGIGIVICYFAAYGRVDPDPNIGFNFGKGVIYFGVIVVLVAVAVTMLINANGL